MISRRCAFVLLAWLGLSSLLASAQQCNTTFFDAAANNPNLGLLSTALTSLAPAEAVSVVPSPGANITVFAPTDTAFLALFQASGLSLGSVTSLQNQLTGVLLQHVLANATSAAQLVAAGEVNSALGEILNASYPVTIKRSGGNVTVSAKANTEPATVLSSDRVCGSWIHVIDAVLLPAANISQTPKVSLAQIAAFSSTFNTSSPAPAPAPAPAPSAGNTTAAAVPTPAPAPPPPNAARVASRSSVLLIAGVVAAAAAMTS